MQKIANKLIHNKGKDCLSFISQPKKQQEFNALLHIYRLYKNIIVGYLDNPTNPVNEDINIFYIRELVPSIKKLIKDLSLDDITIITNKPPLNYILFSSLLVSEQEIKTSGKNSEDIRKEVFSNYGTIKEIAEKIGAIGQKPIKKIEDIINNGTELIYASEMAEVNRNKPKRNSIMEELSIGPLKYTKDGIIYYNKVEIEMRPQLKNLCYLFMQRPKVWIDYYVIKKYLTDPKKEKEGYKTIQKYASALHVLLKKHFRKDVIINNEVRGYFFDIE